MQREPVGDQELNLKKRARRRLVGAIALVLLMVVVLPMLLKDRSASEPKEQITITLPSESAASEPSGFDSSIVDSSIAPSEPANTESAGTSAKVIDETKLTPEAKVDTETAASDAEVATIAAKEAVVKETPKETTNKKFYVQVGVFSDVANVKQLQTKLSDLGYKSQTEKISTDKGQKIRLRTQIFGDRNEAAIALENIKDAGLTGMVVSQ